MNYRELLKQYLDGLGSQQINTVAGLYLVGFADWLQSNAAQHSVHPTPLTLFGMRVEIANWLKPGQWFIRPSRRG